MPLLAINLSDTLFEQVKVLVEKGLYKSFESFIEIAAFNQLAMERGATPAEIVERGHRKIKDFAVNNGMHAAEKSKPPPDPVAKVSRTATVRSVVEPVARMAVPDEARVTEADYEAAFKRFALAPWTAGPKPLAPVADKLSQEQVFGQVNRLLPLKLACRWLANAAAVEGNWPRYEVISDKLADDAATIGTLLERWDSENERKRDELLSTGLPRRGNSGSRDRFLSQFLARVTRGGEIYPAAVCQFQLARFDASAIALTEQGLSFSQLKNPILDLQDKKSTTTLAPEESAFLAEQILEWVPAERKDMQIVLKAVMGGTKTPSELTEAIRGRFPPEWSDSVVQTHTSGLVARLSELRLLRRVWQGRNVTYELGEMNQVNTFLRSETEERS
ncbi:MAG: hypothetical protein JO114_03505 [Planctomycetaceae bacterium]|nr:hypothetical protein [Planctomycetaceae bacterium]